MPKRLLCLPLLLVAIACEDRVVSEILPVTPTGTLAGFVYDATTGAPLEGVKVRLPQLAEEVTTDRGGEYRVENVPASAFVAVRYSLTGYAPAVDEVEIPSSAGNLAQGNALGFSGPIGMLPLLEENDEGFFAQVALESPAGTPVSEAEVIAALDVAFLVDGVPTGMLSARGVPSGDGRFILPGLPDVAALAAVLPGATFRIVIVPPEPLRPRVVLKTAAELAAEAVSVVQLGTLDSALEVIDSNVRDLVNDAVVTLPSTVGAGEPIVIVFNRPIDRRTFFASVVGGNGAPIGVNVDLGTARTAVVSLATPVLRAGARIVIDAHVENHEALGVPAIRRIGYFLSPAPQAGVAFAPYTPDRPNHVLHAPGNPNVLRCPADPGSDLTLQLDTRVGGRTPTGVAIPFSQFLPARVTSAGAPAGSPLDLAANQPPVLARLISDGPVAASGFTTTIRVAWPGVENVPVQPGDVTFSFVLNFQFNQVAFALGAETQVVRAPDGTPLATRDANLTIRIADDCVPPP